MIYHILDEPFSTQNGLALSKDVANIMRYDKSSVVLCPQADETWGFMAVRILRIPLMRLVFKHRTLSIVPSFLRRSLICRIFYPLLSCLNKGDVVWFHNWPQVCAALGKDIHLRGAKVIYHAHNSLPGRAARRALRSFHPDALIFVSEAMRREALTTLPTLRNTHVVYNGVDDTLFIPQSTGASSRNAIPVVLYVGRLVPFKGVHVLLEAMRILQSRGVNAICRIVGPAQGRGRNGTATAYVKELHENCPSNVHFEGFRAVTEISHEYRMADICCCPSLWKEPFGNVVVEAMACAVPVVASRVGGIPEIAKEGGVVLVEPNCAVDLADALQKLIEDSDLRQEVASKGLDSFRSRFTWDTIVKQYSAIIGHRSDLLSNNK